MLDLLTQLEIYTECYKFFVLFMVLLSVHFLCDSALQNDFLEKNKARKDWDGNDNPIWWWCLTAHSFIHGLGVFIVTQSIAAFLFMIVTHWIIDFLKCENEITFNKDQLLHVLVILIISIHLGF